MHTLNITPHHLFGTGPSHIHPDVLQALAHSLIGHLDGQFIELMRTTQAVRRSAFQTETELTFPMLRALQPFVG